jgi:hypothetical protein
MAGKIRSRRVGGATQRPFTVALCTRCGSIPDTSLLEHLRATIRVCHQGILVTTGCLLGDLACAGRGTHTGAVLMLQPCTIERRPLGPARWIGPINADADVVAVCRWIERGQWGLDGLPERLSGAARAIQAATTN